MCTCWFIMYVNICIIYIYINVHLLVCHISKYIYMYVNVHLLVCHISIDIL